MVGELLSVDFIHEDCEEDQMVVHIRVPKGGLVGGWWTLEPLYAEIEESSEESP